MNRAGSLRAESIEPVVRFRPLMNDSTIQRLPYPFFFNLRGVIFDLYFPFTFPSARCTAGGIQLVTPPTVAAELVNPLRIVTGVGEQRARLQRSAGLLQERFGDRLVVARPPTGHHRGRHHRAAQHADRQLHVLLPLPAAARLEMGAADVVSTPVESIATSSSSPAIEPTMSISIMSTISAVSVRSANRFSVE